MYQQEPALLLHAVDSALRRRDSWLRGGGRSCQFLPARLWSFAWVQGTFPCRTISRA